MKNENTTDAMAELFDNCPCIYCKAPATTDELCTCGHTDHTKYGDGLRGICMNSECDCTVFTTATSGSATSTVKQKLQAEIRELKLERDSLKRKVEAAKVALAHYSNDCNVCCHECEAITCPTYHDGCVASSIAAAALKEMEDPG